MKTAFTTLHIILVLAAAFFSVDIMYKYLLPDQFDLPSREAEHQDPRTPKKTSPGSRMNKTRYQTIIKRNLFNAQVEEDQTPEEEVAQDVAPENLEPTKLKLVLWGTVTGSEVVYAVIEDKKQRKQGLYEIGDVVQQATLKKIMRHGVVLNHNGKDQILEMESKNKRIAGKANKAISSSLPVPPELNKAFQEGPASNEVASLMKQVKMRPHFSGGEPDGLMVYGIRPNSVFRQIGLRNGDIIKDINGTPIVQADDALSLYTEVRESDQAKVTLMRRGKEKEIIYHVENGQYVITSLPEHDQDK